MRTLSPNEERRENESCAVLIRSFQNQGREGKGGAGGHGLAEVALRSARTQAKRAVPKNE
jgi:hypothetical protein